MYVFTLRTKAKEINSLSLWEIGDVWTSRTKVPCLGKNEEMIIHGSKRKLTPCFGFPLGHYSCGLTQVSAQTGVRTSGVKWTSWSVLSEISGRGKRPEFGLRGGLGRGVTSVFVEENGDLEVAAGQDPEPCGTGAEWKIRKRDITSRATYPQ